VTAPRPHRRRWDHLPHSTAAQKFNRAVAIKVTGAVGSMACAYIFCLVALIGLPTAWQQSFGTGFHPLPIVQWIAQTFLQLVLLSIILVGQNVSGEASDARSARTLADADAIKELVTVSADRLDCRTDGGLAEVLAAVGEARQDYARTIQAITGATGGGGRGHDQR
jgi:hypothetical protein